MPVCPFAVPYSPAFLPQGRPAPIDQIAKNLHLADQHGCDMVEPWSYFEGLQLPEVRELHQGIQDYQVGTQGGGSNKGGCRCCAGAELQDCCFGVRGTRYAVFLHGGCAVIGLRYGGSRGSEGVRGGWVRGGGVLMVGERSSWSHALRCWAIHVTTGPREDGGSAEGGRAGVGAVYPVPHWLVLCCG